MSNNKKEYNFDTVDKILLGLIIITTSLILILMILQLMGIIWIG